MSRSPIPRSALEHHIAFVGKTGSGKTGSAKSGIVEPALEADERVCVIDPTGAWWGLRLDADGKSKGLPIYVFGGDHGDYPLLATQGEMMAEAIGTTNTPAILDTTKLKTTERMRFFTDFADTILRVNQGPLRLVIDEAHLFAPQSGTRGSGAMPDMLHAANNLISLGRSRGLRIVLISQRPAKVHKDSLTQVESLVAMRLIAPQDRKAVEEWIADQADKETGREIIASLPSLKTGEAWVWSPEVHFLKRVVFSEPRTYDSSRISVGKAAKRLSPIDLEKLQAKFAKVKADAEAADPRALQKKVRELEAQLAKKERESQKAPPAAAAKPAVDREALKAAEQKGFDQARKKFGPAAQRALNKAQVEMAKIMQTRARELVGIVDADFKALRITLPGLEAELTFEATIPSGPPAPPRAASPDRAPRPPTPARVPSPGAGGDGNLSGTMRETLQALAWWEALGHEAPTRKQLGAVLNITPTGSTMRSRLAQLSNAGLIHYPNTWSVALTEEGRAAAPAPAMNGGLIDTIRASLTETERETFDAIPGPGDEISREDLASALGGLEAGGSTLRSRLAALSKRELIRYPHSGAVARQDWVTG